VKKIILLSTVASSLVFASGYRLPENSINSVALSGAYVANTRGADSAYYNPANMVFNENINQVEGTLTYINLSEINYTDKQKPALNSHSEEENLFTPSLFYSSKDYNGLRYGFSMTVPGGLTKRWESPYGKAFAEEFTLKIIELNPSIAYKVNDNFAVGGGLRVIYSEGITKSDATALGKPVVRDMEADTIEYGYNLALTYKPVDEVKVSATYRSNIDLTEEGNAKLYLSGTKLYDGGASVTVPLPAVAAVAISYDYGYTTVEVEYDRTMWSEYKELDFDFKDDIPRALKAAFDDPKPREWEDTDTIRLGITHHLNDKLTLMGGIATDGNPAPEKHIGFELPDSDAMLYSAGVNYKYSKTLSFGASILYDSKDERAVSQGRSLTNTTAIEGEFTDASATLVTVGANYKF
jgi:long-chain fatty acid transport protein